MHAMSWYIRIDNNREHSMSVHQDSVRDRHDTSRISFVRKQHDTTKLSLRIRHPSKSLLPSDLSANLVVIALENRIPYDCPSPC